MKRIFIRGEGTDPFFEGQFTKGFINYGVGYVVFGREVVEESAFGKGSLGNDVVDADGVEAVFVDLPKGGIEN